MVFFVSWVDMCVVKAPPLPLHIQQYSIIHIQSGMGGKAVEIGVDGVMLSASSRLYPTRVVDVDMGGVNASDELGVAIYCERCSFA